MRKTHQASHQTTLVARTQNQSYDPKRCRDVASAEFKMRCSGWWFVGLLLVAPCLGCQQNKSGINKFEPTATPGAAWLSDITASSGLRFQHDPGAVDAFEMPQIMGSGGGLFDYDGDGDLDVFLIGAGAWPPVSDGESIPSRLFRQDDRGQFTDVTLESGLINRGYGMGLAIGDADNDGDLDVFLSNYGDDGFFVNQGDATFRNHTAVSQVSDPNWSTAACFFDYNRDGWLDLVVVNYVDYFPGSPCHDHGGRRDFCGPQAFRGTVIRLYRNQCVGPEADGPQFEDVTLSAGLAAGVGRGLGLSCADFNDDRRPDIFVANDMESNRLWIQQPDGTFQDEASLRGVAVNQWGQAEANMGIVYDDLTGDANPDLFVTHLRGETNTLWQAADGLFNDVTHETGLGPPSLPATGFGVVAVDLEHDGDLDLLIANGHVKRPSLDVLSSDAKAWSEYAFPNQLFLQESSGRFRAADEFGGAFTGEADISRGLCVGDVDGDGDQDVLVTNCRGSARLYLNSAPKSGAWIQLRLTDPTHRRDAYGARIIVEAGGRRWCRVLQPSSSYLSHNDVRQHFGLGSASQVDRIVVQWPDGETKWEVFTGSDVNRQIQIRRGDGQLQERSE